MNIKFEDYSDLETVAIQLDNVLNLLSILGENVFCCNEFSLPPYMAQFVSVNDAAIYEIRRQQKQLFNIFNVLHTKFKLQEQEKKKDEQ